MRSLGSLMPLLEEHILLKGKNQERIFGWYMGNQRIKRLEETVKTHLVMRVSARVAYSPAKEYLELYLGIFYCYMPEWKGLYCYLVGVGGNRGDRHLAVFWKVQNNEELSFPIPDQTSHPLTPDSFLHCGLAVRMMNRKFSFRMRAMQF